MLFEEELKFIGIIPPGALETFKDGKLKFELFELLSFVGNPVEEELKLTCAALPKTFAPEFKAENGLFSTFVKLNEFVINGEAAEEEATLSLFKGAKLNPVEVKVGVVVVG